MNQEFTLQSTCMNYYSKIGFLSQDAIMIKIAINHLAQDETFIMDNINELEAFLHFRKEDLRRIMDSAYSDMLGKGINIAEKYLITSLWSIVNDFMSEIEALWVETNYDFPPEKLAKIKLPLGDYFQMNKIELYKRAIKMYHDSVSTQKKGVAKRIFIWNKLGLKFSPDKNLVSSPLNDN